MNTDYSNVTTLKDFLQRPITEDVHAALLERAEDAIWDSRVECFIIYGATVEDVARLSVFLLEHIDQEDPADKCYRDVLPIRDEEELAGYAIAIAGDVLVELDPHFDLNRIRARMDMARRLVTTHDYLALEYYSCLPIH